jgi:hypothetical protein
MDGDHAAGALPVPRWAAAVLAAIAAALVPWTLYLTWALPGHHTSQHWEIAWGGFDIFLAGILSATAIGLRRGAVWVEASAGVATALLLVDAWFDIVLADPGGERVEAVAMAALGEVPLALFCLWIGLNAERAIRAAGGVRRG